MTLREYIIDRIDAEIINNMGTASSFTMTVSDINKEISDNCKIYKKTLFKSERMEGPAINLASNIQSQIPNEIKVDVEIFERKPQIYASDSYQDVRVRFRITPSQTYVTNRYRSLFSSDFQKILFTRRKEMLNELVRISRNADKSVNICSYGLRVPYGDSYNTVKKYSEWDLKNLGNKEQIFTLAKCITDILNRENKIYKMRAIFVNRYYESLPRDISIDIYVPILNRNPQNNNLQNW